MKSNLLKLNIKRQLRWFFTATVIIFLIGCKSAAELEFERGISHFESKNFERALVHFRRTITRTKDKKLIVLAAQKGAQIAKKKLENPEQAVSFYRIIIANSALAEDRLVAQQSIAQIVFLKLNDYSHAIIEINRVLSLMPESDSKNKFRLMLARSHFYLRQLFQAEVEANQVVVNTKDDQLLFDAQFLIGNIFQASENSEKAIALFEKLVVKYPKLSQKRNVAFNLALSFEEREEFSKAIEVLKRIRDQYPAPEYIDLKIIRLTQRIKNLPGARGLRK